jgi:hypothetical protein
MRSDCPALNLIQRNPVLSPLEEFRRSRRLVVGDVLRDSSLPLLLLVMRCCRSRGKVWFPIATVGYAEELGALTGKMKKTDQKIQA